MRPIKKSVMRRSNALVLPVLLLIAIPALALEDPCSSPLHLDEYVTELSTKVSDDFSADPTAQAKAATTAEVAKRANGDGITDDRLDLLKKAFLALNLGQVDQKDGDLVFNFNPDSLNFEKLGQFSPRVTVHKAELFMPLKERVDMLPESVRQSRADALTKEIGDLDDVEAQLRWTQASGTPRAVLQRIATAIFEPASQEARGIAKALAKEVATSAASIARTLGKPADQILVTEACANPETKASLLKLNKDIKDQENKSLNALQNALNGTLFFKLGDLIEGQPQLSAEGSYRRRQNAAGPDEYSGELKFHMGSVSYWGLQRLAGGKPGDVNLDSVGRYLKDTSSAAPDFSLTVDYTKTYDFGIPLPVDGTLFEQPQSHKLTAAASGGVFFGGGRSHRLELKASYDDISDDPTRQNRFVGTLSWIEKLNATLAQALGGSDLTVTLIYANKPEFRGEVNHDLGLRAGLKWSVGGTSTK
jgi:hypothetical protein